MQLIIAEKPSVANSIAKILGANALKEGYYQGENTLVTWCIGHLVTLAPAEAYNPNYEKWDLADLPIIPEKFQFRVTEGKEKQFGTVKQLLHRPDVEVVINACDAGREGELIFRQVYNFVGCTKPVKRLWISSMEDMAIQEGFQNLKDGHEMENLYQSALCRSMADWIVGINASRLFSCLYKQSLNVGRVLSPTLSMVAERNAEISAFQSVPFYQVLLNCGEFSFTSPRISDKAQAEQQLQAIQGQSVIIQNVTGQEKVDNPPKLYDLTTLQREANRFLGFTAQQTLDYAQALYEKKLVTYPRTDSRYLTREMEYSLEHLSDVVHKFLNISVVGYHPRTDTVVDSTKVSDHHAIIPTQGLEHGGTEKLTHGEREILKLICTRLLSAMSEPCVYYETNISAQCGGEIYTTKGKTVLNQGYRLYESQGLKSDNNILPMTAVGEVMELDEATIWEGHTSPPKQFTEDTLLSAMERAGREEEVEAEFCGIGTPATRAATLEKLVAVNLMARQGTGKNQKLVPTAKGHALITILPDSVKSPLMTADWEEKLKAIEQGTLSSQDFMWEIVGLITNLVATYEEVTNATALFPSQFATVGTCPRCGKNVVDTQKAYSCEDKGCAFILWKDNRFFTLKGKKITETIAKEILTTGKTFLKDCKSEKTGKTYDCTIFLDDKGGKYVDFRMEFVNKGEKK